MVYGKRLPPAVSTGRGNRMKSVYVREEVRVGSGLCRVFCQTADSRSKGFIKAFKRESPRPLLLSSNGDLGGKGK
jgi:hypothetical protein